MIDDAARVAGIEIAPDVRDAMVTGLADALDDIAAIRGLAIANSVAPAFVFDPLPPGMVVNVPGGPSRMSAVRAVAAPANVEDLAFASVRTLSALMRARRISSTALTEMYLARLERLDPVLHCVVTLTKDRALAQAREADRLLSRGRWLGPLHGLPWGAKDLLAVRGFPTTWGAAGFEDQLIDEDATVVKRLDSAGAVLVAKLSLGALAMGDRWFGGMTRNPWRLEQGSSGSSAGSAAAVAAGCVAFAIGSETLGSISSPARRCGVTGLRPTFGRVPRTGAMALSWTMDKLGPLCREVEDCALVLAAIHGPDGRDPGVLRDIPFTWDARFPWKSLRIGWIKSAFEPPAEQASPDENPAAAVKRARREADRAFDRAAIDTLRRLGANLVEIEMPEMPWSPMVQILVAEGAAAFDDLTRSGRDRALTGQEPGDWPNIFRVARFLPAVDYINANRARTLGMQAMARIFEKVDVIVTPTGGMQLVATNMTGHPAVVLPNGLRGPDTPAPDDEDDGGGPGTPASLTFLGGLYQESRLLAVAKAYQDATGFHLARPPLDS
jgi:Asp-tRNA(Asn)/Glu-tRNA(Gln) amidotransferase A subunit family amidase